MEAEWDRLNHVRLLQRVSRVDVPLLDRWTVHAAVWKYTEQSRGQTRPSWTSLFLTYGVYTKLNHYNRQLRCCFPTVYVTASVSGLMVCLHGWFTVASAPQVDTGLTVYSLYVVF